MAKKAAILRGFPRSLRFCFDSGSRKLFICDGKKVSVLTLKTNTWADIYSSVRTVQLFGLSPDDAYLYISHSCGQRLDTQSRVLKIDTQTHEVKDGFSVPLGECGAVKFGENGITIYGIKYDSHVEADGHELFDEYYIRLTVNAADGTNCLESEMEEAEYNREVAALSNKAVWGLLPPEIKIRYYQNDQTEFWDDTKYCKLYCSDELLEAIPHEEILSHVAEKTNYPHYALRCYDKFVLLVGYEY